MDAVVIRDSELINFPVCRLSEMEDVYWHPVKLQLQNYPHKAKVISQNQ